MSLKKFLGGFVMLLTAVSAQAVTLPSQSYESESFSVQYAPAPGLRAGTSYGGECDGEEEFSAARESCCQEQFDACLGAGGDFETCAALNFECMGNSTSLPLDGGAWVLVLLLIAYVSYKCLPSLTKAGIVVRGDRKGGSL